MRQWLLDLLGVSDELCKLRKENGDLRIALYHTHVAFVALQSKYNRFKQIDDNKEESKKKP